MEEPKTIIGSTIKVEGNFASEEDVGVQGNIKGTINTSADLLVESGGTIEAEVQTRNIDIHGTVVGNVAASDKFEIHAGGKVTGDIRAPRVVLADGAKYKGYIDMDEGRSSDRLARDTGTGNQSDDESSARARRR